MKNLLNYTSENISLNNENKNYLSGLMNYALQDFDKAIENLKEITTLNKRDSKAQLYLSIIYLIKNDMKNFTTTFDFIVPGREPSFTALYFVYSVLSNNAFNEDDFGDKKNISREIAKIVLKIHKYGDKKLASKIVNNFKTLGFTETLSYVKLFLTEFLIKENDIEAAKIYIADCNNNEAHRLYSWIHRLEEKGAEAEAELVKYRKDIPKNQDAGVNYELLNLNLPEEVPESEEEILDLISKAYLEAREIIKKIDLEYGTDSMTCLETGCQDCCKKTFPFISYIEYLFMKRWLDKQDEEFKNQIYEKSVQIVNQFKEKYKREPAFVSNQDITENRTLYPGDFKFDCPYLGDNKCNVYEARPFMCRAFGFGSMNGTKFKGCDYFLEQFKRANNLTNTRKLINIESFNEFARNVDFKLIGKKIIAPIPVWFAQSHEETLKKINKL